MKFVIACGIYPPDIGGPAIVIADLVAVLRQRGHQVQVVTYGETLPTDAAIVRISRKGLTFMRYLRFADAVARYLTPETILFATDVFSVGIPCRLALMQRKNMFMVRLGGEWAWEDAVTNGGLRVTLREYWSEHATGFRHRLKVFFYRWILRRAARVIPTSDLLAEVLQKIVPEISERVKVVSNAGIAGDPANVFSSRDLSRDRKTRAGAGPALKLELRLITVGRFAPVKNMPFLARVLKACIDQQIPVACTFVGDGEELEATQKILENIQGMYFVGKKDHTEIARLLSEADVLALPSLSDICPNSVVEALAAGVPCILTSEHGLQKPLHGVFECDPKNEQRWVDAIRSMTDMQRYEKLRAEVQPVANSDNALVDVLTNS